MINIKGRSSIKIKEKRKSLSKNRKTQEHGWNDRFHLAQIPEYSAMNEGNYVGFRALLHRHYQKKEAQRKVVMAPGGIRITRKDAEIMKPFLKLNKDDEHGKSNVSIGSKQQAPSICSSRKQSKKRKKISVDEINTLYDELARQWDEYEIAHHHRECFRDSIVDMKKKMKAVAIVEELDLIAARKSTINKVYKSIDHREIYLNEVYNLADQFKYNPELLEDPELQSKCVDLLEKLRNQTAHMVSTVEKWREYLVNNYSQTTKPVRIYRGIQIPFIWMGQNYYLKLKTDYYNIANSPIGQLFPFPKKYDPLFLAPGISKPLNKKKGKKINKFGGKVNNLSIPISSNWIYQCKEYEYLLYEELECNRRKTGRGAAIRNLMKSKIDKENKRTMSTISQDQSTPEIKVVGTKESKTPSKVRSKLPLQDISLGNQRSNQNMTPVLDPQYIHPDWISLAPLPLKETQIQSFLSFYYTQLPQSIINSFLSPDLLFNIALSTGSQAQWIMFLDNEKGEGTTLGQGGVPQNILGLMVFHIDNSPTNKNNRVNIIHFSTLDLLFYPAVIRLGVKYIWNNMPTSEIRIALYHHMVEGKYEIDQEVKEIFTKQIGFRWKTLTNDKLGKRIMVLGQSRPEESIFINPRRIRINTEPIMFKVATVATITNNYECPERNINEEKILSKISLINALRKIGQHRGEYSNQSSMENLPMSTISSPCQSEIQKLLSKFECNQFRIYGTQELNMGLESDMQDLNRGRQERIKGELDSIKHLGLNINFMQNNLDNVTSSLVSVSGKWHAHNTFNRKGFCYVRIIDTNISIGTIPNYNSKLIIIPTDDYRLNIILITINDEQRKNVEGTDLYDYIKNAYNEAIFEEEDKYIKEVCFPGFKYLKSQTNLKQYTNMQIKGSAASYLKEVYETGECEIYAPEPAEGFLSFEENTKRIMIDTEFIFCLVEDKMDEILDLALSCFVVNRSHWTVQTTANSL